MSYPILYPKLKFRLAGIVEDILDILQTELPGRRSVPLDARHLHSALLRLTFQREGNPPHFYG